MNRGTARRLLREREIALRRMKELMKENSYLRLENGQIKAKLVLVEQVVGNKSANGKFR